MIYFNTIHPSDKNTVDNEKQKVKSPLEKSMFEKEGGELTGKWVLYSAYKQQ